MIKKKLGKYMLEQYQTEIFALIAIVIVVVIYLITKKKNTKVDDTLDIEKSSEELAQIEVDEPQETLKNEDTEENIIEEKVVEVEEEVIEKEAEPKDELTGSEEGTFEDIPQQRLADITPPIKPKHYISKRSVPPHGKITKENFKEFAGTRILVAEDNIINQKVIKGLLAGTGIEISIADDGQDTLDLLERDSDFLLILMDAHMPRVDGFEATRAIRANPNYDHILVVALSGDTAVDDVRKMTESGMSEHLEKPLRMEALYDILYAYTGQQSKKKKNLDYVNVIMTKELDGDQGLSICGGDEGFYHEILDEFVTTYENSTQELGDLLRTGELKDADKLLLDLVGVTANIGAKNLNEISLIIKASLNDTTEKSYLTLVDQYRASLDNLIKDIKEYR